MATEDSGAVVAAEEAEYEEEEPWPEDCGSFAALGPWLACGEAQLLPCWSAADEKPENVDAILDFHTQPCSDFQRGFCAKHGARGKASRCFCYHFESQRRRSPVHLATGQLKYWETPCPAWSSDMGYCCPAADACPFAHGREEVSYHPSKYKTRLCNGHDCRGEGACCFAHSEEELRLWAPGRYSQAAAVALAAGHHQQTLEGAARQQEALFSRLGASSGVGATSSYSSSQKVRFCASYPNVSQCRRGAACSFAHSRDEVQTPLLSKEEEEHEESAMTQAFFTRKFKTMWCPIGAQHDWQTCVYAHTYQDARRQPSIGYGPQPCPYWSKKDTRCGYAQRCPLGLRCPFSHGAKEQLYHPKYFRTVTCRDMQMKGCPRQSLCAFYHRRSERRKQQPADTCDYGKPIPKQAIDGAWAEQFLNPPIFQDAANEEDGAEGYGGMQGCWPAAAKEAGMATDAGLDSARTQSTAAGDAETELMASLAAKKAASRHPLAYDAWLQDTFDHPSFDMVAWMSAAGAGADLFCGRAGAGSGPCFVPSGFSALPWWDDSTIAAVDEQRAD